jgi:rare lipoprotein A
MEAVASVPVSARLRLLQLVALGLVLAGCQTLEPALPAKPSPASLPPPVAPPPSEPTATPATPAPAKPETPETPQPFRNIYQQDKDSAPASKRDVDYLSIPDAVPKAEPRGKYGNKSPYTVNGRTYRVLADARGYSAEGGASWYGEKFHGHRTSSFEPYDMYAMTAAHTTLPIPSYVRVTNLGNGRSVIVRVNDRGPFHRGRIIDLSWAAAQKLGYANVGTARVRVEVVEADAEPAATEPDNSTPPVAADASAASPGDAQPAAVAEPPPPPDVAPGSSTAAVQATPPPAESAITRTGSPDSGFFVQLGAFTFPDAARKLAEQARASIGEPVQVLVGDDALHRVRVGPYEDRASAERMRDLLAVANLGKPALVFVPAQP